MYAMGMHNAMLVTTEDQHPCCMHILKIWSRHCAFPYLHVFWDAHKARNRGEKNPRSLRNIDSVHCVDLAVHESQIALPGCHGHNLIRQRQSHYHKRHMMHQCQRGTSVAEHRLETISDAGLGM